MTGQQQTVTTAGLITEQKLPQITEDSSKYDLAKGMTRAAAIRDQDEVVEMTETVIRLAEKIDRESDP